MRLFIIKAIAFFLIVLGLFLTTIMHRVRGIGSDYMKGLKIKHDLVEKINGPKLLFAGGSNLAFGIDSKKISDSLGISVVNMGLNASLGTDFLLDDIKSCAKEGDVVVFSIEYFLFKEGISSFQLNAIKYYPKAKDFLPKNNAFILNPYLTACINHYLKDSINHYLNDSKNQIEKLFRNEKEVENTVYSSKSFNQYGDVVGHLNQPRFANLKDEKKIEYKYWNTLDDLNKFIDYANRKKIKVFYLFPCYTESQFEVNKTPIKKLEADARMNLNCKILNRPEDFVYPDSLFFDTVYHLGKEGREKRTNKLISLLSQDSSFLRAILPIRTTVKSLKQTNL